MGDPYSKPEEFGLTFIGECDSADSYEFDMTAVFRHDESGQWYYVDDSGCSCPSPFERVASMDDLTPATRAEVIAHLILGHGAAAHDLVERIGTS